MSELIETQKFNEHKHYDETKFFLIADCEIKKFRFNKSFYVAFKEIKMAIKTA